MNRGEGGHWPLVACHWCFVLRLVLHVVLRLVLRLARPTGREGAAWVELYSRQI